MSDIEACAQDLFDRFVAERLFQNTYGFFLDDFIAITDDKKLYKQMLDIEKKKLYDSKGILNLFTGDDVLKKIKNFKNQSERRLLSDWCKNAILFNSTRIKDAGGHSTIFITEKPKRLNYFVPLVVAKHYEDYNVQPNYNAYAKIIPNLDVSLNISGKHKKLCFRTEESLSNACNKINNTIYKYMDKSDISNTNDENNQPEM